MKKRKTVRKEDFKKWLQRRQRETFGDESDNCPLHDWLGQEVSEENLEKLPRWCSRFVGHWDAVHPALPQPDGEEALAIMNELY